MFLTSSCFLFVCSEMSGAGAGAGGDKPPFLVDWEKLERAFHEGALDQLREDDASVDYFFDDTGGKKRGLKMQKKDYRWVTIARMWNNNVLHDAWGVDHGDLEELFRAGS